MKQIVIIICLLVWSKTQSQSAYNLIAEYKDNAAYFQHIVQPEETMYSISKQYRVDVPSILKLNHYADNTIHQGQIIKIPYIDSLLTSEPGLSQDLTIYQVYYQVKPQDNLYAIARRYFHTDINEIKKLNKLPNNNLDLGQILVLGYYPLPHHNADLASNHSSTILKVIDSTTLSAKPGYIKKNGTAILSQSGSGSGNYILHRTAKVNSEIYIFSPLTNRSVKAKVIGRIPDNLYQPEIDMVVSNTLAQSLHVRDKKFFVKQTYLPEN